VDISNAEIQPETTRPEDQSVPISVGSSEIVVEERSVKDLLSKFKKEEVGCKPIIPVVPFGMASPISGSNTITSGSGSNLGVPGSNAVIADSGSNLDISSSTTGNSGPALVRTISEPESLPENSAPKTEEQFDLQIPPIQTNPVIATLANPAGIKFASMTSLASSSVTSFASEVSNDQETDTDKGKSFYKAILRRSSGKISYNCFTVVFV
jgi:hypothetical protein